MTTSEDRISTRLLIISDTHGEAFPVPKTPVDVAIHCGDLTEESKLEEYAITLKLLQDIQAPLKLAIAGNHDFSLDTNAFQRILHSSAFSSQDDEAVVAAYGKYGQAEAMFAAPGVTLLNEGTHSFILENGAKLTVYANPYTPSKSAGWGFQYIPKPVTDASPDASLSSSRTQGYPDDGHVWAGPETIDVAITHSPPHGLLDRTQDAIRGGAHGLFAVVERARPRLHCFGHIHEGWGAKLVAWRNSNNNLPSNIAGQSDITPERQKPASHLTHIDNGASTLIESLATLKPGRFDVDEAKEKKRVKAKRLRAERRCEARCEDGKTLFVNASIPGDGEELQLPWIVQIDLPRAE
ncbi:Metallo-dependent phosphatase [Sarocladium strictum]